MIDTGCSCVLVHYCCFILQEVVVQLYRSQQINVIKFFFAENPWIIHGYFLNNQNWDFTNLIFLKLANEWEGIRNNKNCIACIFLYKSIWYDTSKSFTAECLEWREMISKFGVSNNKRANNQFIWSLIVGIPGKV